MNLKVQNLSFKYGRRKPEVLTDFNIDISRGGIVGILGPNGVGKSTLLYLIAGLLTPKSGEVTYCGVNTRLRLPAMQSSIFIVPEEVFFPKLTIDKYLNIFAPFYPGFDKTIFDDCLNEFAYQPTGNIMSVSMGQKKKIILSLAFASGASLLLLDEPTNGLDIPGKAAFRRLCARYASDEKIFLVSTHQVRDLDQLLDHIVIMNMCSPLLNADTVTITEKLKFLSGTPSVPEGALFSAPTIGGFNVILQNNDNSETPLNIETLFDLVMNRPELINSIFNPEIKQENE